MAGLDVGLGEDEGVVGDARVRDPVLLPAQDIRVGFAACGRAQRRDVRPRPGLGQAETCELLAPGLRSEPALLLLLGSVAQDGERIQPDVDGDECAKGGFAALDFLAGERFGDEVETGAAVLLGDDDPEEPELRHALDQVEIELVVDVVLDRDGKDALVDEGPDRFLSQALLVAQLEVHRCSSANAGRPSIDTAFRSRT